MTLPAADSLFAAEVQYWRLEPDYWRAVLEAAVAAGLPGISGYVPWEVHEIAPGKFDFDGVTDPRRNLRRFLEMVREAGLKLAYRPGPFICNEMPDGGHPRRLVTANEALMVKTADGEFLTGYNASKEKKYQPSYMHPDYLAEVRTWINAVDAVAKDFSAAKGGPIHTVNLDNELSYLAKDSMFGCDYNDCMVGRGGFYHQWLAGTYGSAGSLPYEKNYTCFEDVEPPRALGPDVQSNLQWYIDWVRFKEWLLGEYLQEIRRMHEAAGLEGVHYYTNFNPHRPEAVPTNFKIYAEATDGLCGYDFYRSPWLGYSGYCSLARVLKLLDATLPLTWSAEFMGGWWFTNMRGNRIPRSHTEFMGLSALANGCKAISWFMFHDRDNWGDAPVSEMGHRRENHVALTNIMRLVKAIPEWNELRVQTDLAVIYYRPYMWHDHLGDPMPCADNDLHRGEPELFGAKAGDAVAMYEAAFRLAQLAGYTAAAVDLSDKPENLALHKLAWFGAAGFIEAEANARLRAYVENGGILIVEGGWPVKTMAGEDIDFLGLGGALEGRAPRDRGHTQCGHPRRQQLGQGAVVYFNEPLADVEPGQEDLGTVAGLKSTLHELLGPPLVDVTHSKIRYRSSQEWKEENYNHVDAILQAGGGARYVFMVNLHERATLATVTCRDIPSGKLDEIGGVGASFSITAGQAALDLDRKSVRVFRLS